MSTDYHLHCLKCDQYGGLLTRQAGCVGNFDIITTFKFAMLHILHCGEEYLRFVCEDHTPYLDKFVEFNPELKEKFLDDTKHIAPHSDDWETVRKHPGAFDLALEEWEKDFRGDQ